jgi:four helix bundle protein
MASAASHRDLVVWQKSMDLVEEAYRVGRSFPGYERYGLRDQIRRAAVAIPTNIAEGSGRGSQRDYARFIGIARGSLLELETLLMLSLRLGYATEAEVSPLIAHMRQISKMLISLRNHLRQTNVPPATN